MFNELLKQKALENDDNLKSHDLEKMEAELKELLIEAEKLKADYKNLEPFRRELVFRRIN